MRGHISYRVGLLCTAALFVCTPAQAAVQQAERSVRDELDEARRQIEQQREQLRQQEERLRALETRINSPAAPPAAPVSSAQQGVPTGPVGQAPIGRVGQAPDDYDRPVEVAVLGQQGSIITRAGQLTAEAQFEYARADRNRAIFRGIEIVESVLIGVFDINESRQDVLTASGSLRYGVTDRLELGVRLPFVHRSDASIIAPVAGSTPDDNAASIDNSAKGTGIGDLELSARYQLTNARGGWPFLIANVQAVLPTGEGPFDVPRNSLGQAQKAATGAGFIGISPSITAILPTDPVVLFGTLGYTFNLAKDVETRIPPVIIDRVNPGDSLSFSAGIGIAFNQRTSVNFGYAHNWGFGTTTVTRLISPGPNDPGPVTRQARDLQIGRFLFGVTYRINNSTSLNWSVEVGATDDATDLRTVLRIPLVLLRGR